MGIVTKRLNGTLNALAETRDKNGTWTDAGTDGPGLIKTAEALDCFFQATLGISGIEQRLKGAILNKDLDAMVAFIERNGWAPDPYLNEVKEAYGGYISGVTDFTDTVSFVTTTFLGSIAYQTKLGMKTLTNQDKYYELARSGVRWLLDNVIEPKRGKISWSSGIDGDKQPSVYFAFTAVSALSYVLETRFLEDEIMEKEIENCLTGCYEWCKDLIQDDADDPKKVTFAAHEDKPMYNMNRRLGLVYAVLIFKGVTQNISVPIKINTAMLSKIAYTIEELYKRDRESFVIGGAHFVSIKENNKPKTIGYEDRGLLQTCLEGIVWIHLYLLENNKAKESDRIHEFMSVLKKFILDEWDPDTRLWNRAYGFQIYFNQCSIASLAAFVAEEGDSFDDTLMSLSIKEAALKEIIRVAIRETEDNTVDRVLLKINEYKESKA